MKIQDVERVCNEFAKHLTIPTREKWMSFDINSDDTAVEMNLVVNDTPVLSLSVDTKNIRVLYTERYRSDDYMTVQYGSSITLTYYLCVFVYKAFFLSLEVTFNEMLTLLFEDEINEWQDVAVAIAKNAGLTAEERSGTLVVNGTDISYNDGVFTYAGINLTVEKTYTGILDAVFIIVEYIANLSDAADDLFKEPDTVESNLLEEDENDDGGDTNINIEGDVGLDNIDGLLDEEEPGPVEPMPNEDFSEPVTAVVTPEDVM